MGTTSQRAQALEPQIKGSVMLGRLEFVRERAGEEGLLRLLASLSAEDGTAISGLLLPSAWYSFALMLRLDEALAKLLSPTDPDAAFLDMGAASATRNLAGHHASFLAPGEPHRFLGNSPQIYRLYYDTGSRAYERLDDCSGVVRTFAAESVTRADCLTVIGWYQQGLAMCGAIEPHGSHSVCRAKDGPHCEYVFTWSGVAKKK